MNALAATNDASLVIEKWFNTFVVSTRLPDPQDIRARLNRLVQHELAACCQPWLASLVIPADPSVWIIRSLSLDIAVDARPDTEWRIAREWAGAFAGTIGKVLAGEGNCDSVVRFPDRTAYLAQFLKDLLCGSAWDRWYYAEFDSLRSLPPASAACEALLRVPGCTSAVLLQLAKEARLEQFLNSLHERDASRVYASLFPPTENAVSSAAGERAWTARLLGLWHRIALQAVRGRECDSRDALRVYLFAAQYWPDESLDLGLQSAIDGLLHLLLRFAMLRDVCSLDPWLDLQHAAGFPSLPDVSDAQPESRDTLAFLLRVSGGDPDWARKAAEILIGQAAANSDGITSETFSAQSFQTSFGGIFLLAQSFLDCHIEECIEAAAVANEERKAVGNLLRLLLAVRCLGRPRALEAIQDPALGAFAGVSRIPQQFEALILGAELQSPALELLNVLERQGVVSGECLLAEMLPLPFCDCDAMILAELPSNEWIYACPVDHDRGDTWVAVREGVRWVGQSIAQPVQSVFLGPTLLASADCFPLAEDLRTDGVEQVAPFQEIRDGLPRMGARELAGNRIRLANCQPPSKQELSYFVLRNAAFGWQWSPSFELACTLLARAVLRNLARKLIGFEASSPEYLFRNFLTGPSSVLLSARTIEVHMPESPLQVVLRLSGLYGTPVVIPWLEDRELCLLAPPQ
jgi:hypothetical protein